MSARPVDAKEPAREIANGLDLSINPPRLPDKVDIEATDDDSSVRIALFVQANEVATIQGQDRADLLGGKGKYGGVAESLIRLPGFLERHDIVIEGPQLHRYGERQVLIGQESRHASRRLVLLDLSLDLAAVYPVVVPGMHQVFGT